MVSRRQLLGGMGAVGSLGAGVFGARRLRRPDRVVESISHDGITERAFTLDERSYVDVEYTRDTPYAYVIYRESEPREIQFVYSGLGDRGEYELQNPLEAVLEPGNYRIQSFEHSPGVQVSSSHRFRETDQRSIRLGEYLDLISLFDTPDPYPTVQGPKFQTVVPAESLFGTREPSVDVIGLDPTAPVTGRGDRPAVLARSTTVFERLVERQARRIGGGTADRLDSIRRRNERARVTGFLTGALPSLSGDGLRERTYSELLSAMLDDSRLASSVPNDPATVWYAQPATLEGEETARVPVGLGFELDESEIDGLERTKLLYSPQIQIPMRRTQASPPVWTVETDVEAILQRVTEAITEEG